MSDKMKVRKNTKKRYRVTADIGKTLFDNLQQSVDQRRYRTKSDALRAYIEGKRLSPPKELDEGRAGVRLLLYANQQLDLIYNTHAPHLTREEHAKLMVVSVFELLELLRQMTGVETGDISGFSGEPGQK